MTSVTKYFLVLLLVSPGILCPAFGQDRGDRGFRDRGDRGDRDRSDRDRGGFGGGGFGGAPSGFGGGFGGPPGSFGGPPGGFGGPPGGFGGPPGGFGGDDRSSRFGSMMDANGNGKIDQEEIDRMPSFVKDMMKARGIELKPGTSLDDMRNSFRSSFNGGSPPGQQGPNGQNSQNAASGVKSLTPYRMKPKKPLTLTLPPAYSDLDTDFDGQIGLHEWLMTRRADVDQFDSMDIDEDGYLIPEELLAAEQASASQAVAGVMERKRLLIVSATPTKVASNPSGQKPPDPNASTSGGNSRSSWGGDPATVAPEIFKRLDGNGDGYIDTDEWQQSRRTRSMFEAAGIRLERMSVEQFSQHYTRLAGSGR